MEDPLYRLSSAQAWPTTNVDDVAAGVGPEPTPGLILLRDSKSCEACLMRVRFPPRHPEYAVAVWIPRRPTGLASDGNEPSSLTKIFSTDLLVVSRTRPVAPTRELFRQVLEVPLQGRSRDWRSEPWP
jgi:hypothetical protein